MDAIAERDSNLILLVAHGGTIINIIIWWLRLDITSLPKISFDAALTSISVLRTNDWQKRIVERLNDTAHLYEEKLAGRIYLDL
jgi:2,3-bisphosphoglycerate-dependent phosphoglycerate mutase